MVCGYKFSRASWIGIYRDDVLFYILKSGRHFGGFNFRNIVLAFTFLFLSIQNKIQISLKDFSQTIEWRKDLWVGTLAMSKISHFWPWLKYLYGSFSGVSKEI